MADQILDTVLLLALPASGKSEVRRYLNHLSPESRTKDFHMGPTVQLDDFPYVHVMRRIDDELAARGKPRIYFQAPDRSFQDGRDWGTLIQLIDEDHEDVVSKRLVDPSSAAELLLSRIDKASTKVGAAPRIERLDAGTRKAVAAALEKEARAMLDEKQSGYPDTLAGKTLVVEFARGGAHGAPMPLAAPFGYQYSLGQLSEALLSRATILYVWVTPEESRRKNEARTDPNDPGSILHHGVPHEVMMNDYGCDDFDWLEKNAEKPGTVTVKAHGKTFHVPFARFDNRVDKTSFLRNEQKDWKADEVKAVHEGLKNALQALARTRADS